MIELTIDGVTVKVPLGKRLVLAIEEEGGVDIGHRCGGNAKCTTCRVEFLAGEPDTMTMAEFDRLEATDLLGEARLSCQIVCEADMHVRPLMTLQSEGWGDTGPTPEETVTPESVWYPMKGLEEE